MKAFAKVGATLVATSLLFGPVYVSARDGQLTAGESADGATGAGKLVSVFGREATRVSDAAIDEGRSNGSEGETKRQSKLARRASTSLSRQSGALQKLLIGALVSMGMLSAVRLGKEVMRGPSGGDEEAVRRASPSVAGLSNRSLPNSLLAGAITLLVIASTLATPLHSKHSKHADGDGVESEKNPPNGFSFFYKGKHCEVTFDPEERRKYGITDEDLRTASKTLSSPPKKITFKEEGGGTEYFWGAVEHPEQDPALLSFFSLEDGRQYLMKLPLSIVRCPSCREQIRTLGEEVKNYELLLTRWQVEKSSRQRPHAQVHYEWSNGRTLCRIGGPEREGAMAAFSIGDTDFKIVLPKEVTDALAGRAGNRNVVFLIDPDEELLGDLLKELSREPKMVPIRRNQAASVLEDKALLKVPPHRPFAELHLGDGPNGQDYPGELIDYKAYLPQLLPMVLRRANNNAWPLLQDLLQASFPPVLSAMLRDQMRPN